MSDEAVATDTVVTETTEAVATPVTPLNELFGSETKQEGTTPSPVETKPGAEAQAEGVKLPEVKGEEKEETPSLDNVLEKRLKDTRDYATRVQQENVEVKRQLAQQAKFIEKISKQLDGTWTDEDEKTLSPEHDAPSPDAIASMANAEGRISASREAAFSIYGEPEVNAMLFAEDAPFRAIENDPIVQQKILSSNAPVIEAMKIVKARQFFDKYGYSPSDIEANMRKALEAEITDKVTKKLTGKSTVPKGLGDIATTGVTVPQGGITPLKELFG